MLLNPEQVARMKAQKAAAQAPAAAPAAPTPSPNAAAAPAPTPVDPLTPAAAQELVQLGQLMTDAGLISSVEMARACVEMAGLMLTHPLCPEQVSRARFVELAGQAYDRAAALPLDQRAKPGD